MISKYSIHSILKDAEMIHRVKPTMSLKEWLPPSGNLLNPDCYI